MANPLALFLPLLLACQEAADAKVLVVRPHLSTPAPARPQAVKPAPAPAPANPRILMRQRLGRQLILEPRLGKKDGRDPAEETLPPDDDDVPADLVIATRTLDVQIFESDQDPAAQRDHLHAILDERIKRFGNIWNLNDDQRNLLRLAGTGDIERLFGRVAAARAAIEAVREDFDASLAVLDRVFPLRREYANGPFGPESMFVKTLGTILKEAHDSRIRTNSIP